MRQLTYDDHMAAALDGFEAIRRIHDRAAVLIEKLPDAKAAAELDWLLRVIETHAAGCRQVFAEAGSGH